MSRAKRLQEEEIQTIQALLVHSDKTQQEIADECKVHINTVQKIKKELPQQDEATKENLKTLYKSLIYQEHNNKLLRRKQDIYEDTAEGWLYTLSKEQIKAKGKCHIWWGVVYPESADPNWIEKLTNTHCELAISPLHDKDKREHDSDPVVNEETGEILKEQGFYYKQGDPKKPHWHYIIKFDKPVNAEYVHNLLHPITKGPWEQRVNSCSGAYNYLTHSTDAAIKQGKYQYDVDEIQKFNNFIVEMTKKDEVYMIVAIKDTIKNNEFTNYMQIFEYYQDSPEMIALLCSKQAVVNNLLDSEWRRQNPDRVQKVQLVDR